MTQNPFENLGGGGFDMNALLEQAQQMQAQIEQAQQRLHEEQVQGQVAGGAVTVTVNGVGELVQVDVSPGVVDGQDTDSLVELGDLVVAAYRDAKSQADELASRALGPLGGDAAGGLPGLG